MDCARVDDELVAFELAVLDGATRAAVETHLTGCARCVSTYLALKRAIDAGEEAMAPSQIARARVRAEAEKLLSAAERKKPERKKAPWVIGLAAAAAIVAPFAWQALRTTRTAAVHDAATETAAPGVVPVKLDETIDTARTTPENLAFL
ncbi:MAG TPA: zf-HC2 domain-containing protein [Polyangia bacterium]